jgi:succinoglycan biosynthesis transport protein ExoP
MNHINNLFKKNDIKSASSEAYRILRANLYFTSTDKKIKTVLITSPDVGEGKTTTAANLAIVLAHAGNKTVFLGADLRRPKEVSLFELKSSLGLAQVISEKLPYDTAIFACEDVENLFIFPAGRIPPNPSEILQSKSMKDIIEQLRRDYDYIIIDAPPVNLVSDAVILAGLVDGVILVVAENETKKDIAKRSVKLLKKIGANILGVVITKVKNKKIQNYYQKY